MIRKIIGIRNVGRFAECGSHGDVEFRRYNFLFAENGRGKSTLCAILRSLQSGEPAHIEGRKRLGQVAAPEVVLRLENNNVTYRNGGWDTTYADIMIFDSTFVHENVYAGDVVDHGHKRNLHRVIIGRHGVALARTVENLDEQIREANRELAARRGPVDAVVPRGMDLPAFLALPAVADVTERIAAQERAVASATQATARATEIRNQPGLRRLDLPASPFNEAELAALLGTRIGEVGAEVERAVREHLANHTQGARQAWLAEGRRVQRGDTCPYCAQSTVGVELVRAYSILFADAYTGLRERITTAQTSVNRALGAGASVAWQNVVGQNDRVNEFWRTHLEINVRDEALVADLRAAAEEWRAAADELLAMKLAAPLEPIAVSPRFTTAHTNWSALRPRVETYNTSVDGRETEFF